MGATKAQTPTPSLSFLFRGRKWIVTFFFLVVGTVWLLGLEWDATKTIRLLKPLQKPFTSGIFGGGDKDLDSSCPGYALTGLRETGHGIVAQLVLGGAPCNVFGSDIQELTIEVTHETKSRLHVNIYDSHQKQFVVPESVFARPPPSKDSLVDSSDLVFNHQSSPFAFWITRRSDPSTPPLFDTRPSSLPTAPISQDAHAALAGSPLVFEDRYLQITSAVPKNTNIYGLGEVIATSGFRRAMGSERGGGTLQALWARDVMDPTDENLYGAHPVYIEHRFDEKKGTSSSHGVFLLSSAGADVLLFTPQNADISLVQYRLLGGVLDFYFFSGPGPKGVIEQYGEVVGLPLWQPMWAFGFQLCRWGYETIDETREQVKKMREANIPLEVMWNDIDLYDTYRDFTTDAVRFPGEEIRAFIEELRSNHQRYIPIVDAAISVQRNPDDQYDPFIKGVKEKVFITNSDGSLYVGKVWPGYTVFPDWFAPNTQSWWDESLKNWTKQGVEFSGIWLDMNEPSSFCDGSCGTGKDWNDTSLPFSMGGAVRGYPEGYDEKVSGPSGNITVKDKTKFAPTTPKDLRDPDPAPIVKRAQESSSDGKSLYRVHSGYEMLSSRTVDINGSHPQGFTELDVHNLWGLMEQQATFASLKDIIPGKRPFVISRSTFPSSGKYAGHWLGDNFSTWRYMHFSIQGILQFQIFQIPMVGADTCGFARNAAEELCNRWMQLSAFTPFYRNHNSIGALSQEPYRWDSVAEASRIAIGMRYSLLPYWYSLFANASLRGTPPMRALWFEFPDEPELFGVDRQFMIGSGILVTPVLDPGAREVSGILPGRGSAIWRDWYTHDVVVGTPGTQTSTKGKPGDGTPAITATFDAPLSHINVHSRGGSALLLHSKPGYTIEETTQGPFSLLVSLDVMGQASGWVYLDDGISDPPGPSTTLSISAEKNRVVVRPSGTFRIESGLAKVTVLGVDKKPKEVRVNGVKFGGEWAYREDQQELEMTGVEGDLNGELIVDWDM